jgi:hypothetical protein
MSKQKTDARTTSAAAVREIHDQADDKRVACVAKTRIPALAIKTTENKKAGMTVFQ